MIKVAIIDSPQWIDFLINILSQYDDMEVIWSTSSLVETFQKANSRRIDVLLVDVDLVSTWFGGLDIVNGIKEIKHVKIITLTKTLNEDAIIKSFLAGAIHCLAKSNFKQIPEIIRIAYYQETKLIDILLKDYRRLKVMEAKEKIFYKLSSSQKEVINLYIMDYQTPTIASLLHYKRTWAVRRVILRSARVMNLKKKNTGEHGYREEIRQKIGIGVMNEKIKILTPVKPQYQKKESNILWDIGMNRKINIGVIGGLELVNILTDLINQCNDIDISWGISVLTDIFKTGTVDIILVDLNLIEKWVGGFDIVYETAKIKDMKVIALVQNLNKNSILKSFTAGAVACESNSERILDSIRITYHNHTPSLASLTADYRRLRIFEEKEKLFYNLTPVQKEIMDLYITNKYLIKEIAANLHKLPNNVSYRIYYSVKKMGLRIKKFHCKDPDGRGYQKQIYRKIGLGIISEKEIKKRLRRENSLDSNIT